jgi:stage V sporulation protein B
VGYLLKVLSPIVPLMYLDSISDGILKGLDQQNYTFFTALSDSSLRIVLVIALLPFMGLKGFIIIMYFSNLFTCLLHISRLIKISKAKLKLLGEIIIPLVSALTVALLSNTLLNIFAINSNLVYIILLCVISIASYSLLLLLFGTVTVDEIKNIIK